MFMKTTWFKLKRMGSSSMYMNMCMSGNTLFIKYKNFLFNSSFTG